MRNATLQETMQRPTLDELPYPDELAGCSPAMREIAQVVSEEMGAYLEERV